MSGYGNHHERLAVLDCEILHYAALCDVDVADHAAIHRCLTQRHDGGPADKPRETLQGRACCAWRSSRKCCASACRRPH